MPWVDNALNPSGTPDYIWAQEHPDVPAGPEWVPDDAVIHIDFLGGAPQGRAWTEAAGEVGIATLLGNDPAVYDYVPNDTGYNASLITSNGYDPRGSGLQTAFIGAARTKILAGVTMRLVQKRMIVDVNSARALSLVSENGDEERSFAIGIATVGASRTGSSGRTSSPVLLNVVNGIEAMAFTHTSARMEIAAMGHGAEGELIELIITSPAPMIGAWIDYTKNYATVQSITIYDPLPTTAGLPELSAP